jgi:ribonuclease HI
MESIFEQIKKLEETLLQRHTRADREMLAMLLHDEFEEIGASGDICTKNNAIQWLLREDDAIQWSLTDYRVRQLADDMVLATYCAHKADLKTGAAKQSMRSSLWVKSNTGWAMRFHQGTNILDA